MTECFIDCGKGCLFPWSRFIFFKSPTVSIWEKYFLRFKTKRSYLYEEDTIPYTMKYQ